MAVMIVNDIEEHNKTEKTEEEEEAESMDKLKAIVWPMVIIGMFLMTVTIDGSALHSPMWMIPTIMVFGLTLGFDSSVLYADRKKGWKQWIAISLTCMALVACLLVFVMTASRGFYNRGYTANLIRCLALGSLLRWMHTIDMVYGVWRRILDYIESLSEGREKMHKFVKHVWWMEHVMVGMVVLGCIAANCLAVYVIKRNRLVDFV
ncbi:hypothetical protein HK407_14g18770 [Ordospora pajunii]|uniref:uncharacterized protein n=1 Tax=Ordospora pajunii TaxID=3039483 RepID=UPI002952760D|nr:uncharacterized protein HK407_14g18770 [Ordospora pajunii]KAH9410534.1 hypothetical protein HK407_14g18770 [Ordospora pajunii]